MEMQSLFQTGKPGDWTDFLRINCDALFETALLLTADPEEAEASVVEVIDSIDASFLPDDNELANLQEELARRAIQNCREPVSPQIAEAGSMLRNSLRPVLHIHRCPRICFVLRMLLGYATSTCARRLGIEEAAVKVLIRTAFLQLRSAVAANDLHEERIQDMSGQGIDSSFKRHETKVDGLRP